MAKVPFTTVTFSVVGCQCGAIFAPSVQERRNVLGLTCLHGVPLNDGHLKLPAHFHRWSTDHCGCRNVSSFLCSESHHRCRHWR